MTRTGRPGLIVQWWILAHMLCRLTAALALIALTVSATLQTPIDDAAIERSFESSASRLIQGGLLDAKKVAPQLERRRWKGKLAAAPSAGDRPESLYDKVSPATLVVGHYYHCKDCKRHHSSNASGFLISPDGLAVTNYHVVKDAGLGLIAMSHDGKLRKVAEVLASDPKSDVALIRVEGTGLPYLTLASPPRVGSPVSVLSHPDGAYYYFSQGSVARFSKDKGVTWLEITADYGVGSSGGPVVNALGQVVGVVSETITVMAPGEGDEPDVPQMVRHRCVPASAIKLLFEPAIP